MGHRLICAIPAIVIFTFPFAARADLTGSVTLVPNDRFSFDTGVTTNGNVATGDVRFNSNNLVSQGDVVGIYNYRTSGAAGPTLYNGLTQQALSALSYSTTLTLNAAALVVGDVFAVHTVGGYYAKVADHCVHPRVERGSLYSRIPHVAIYDVWRCSRGC